MFTYCEGRHRKIFLNFVKLNQIWIVFTHIPDWFNQKNEKPDKSFVRFIYTGAVWLSTAPIRSECIFQHRPNCRYVPNTRIFFIFHVGQWIYHNSHWKNYISISFQIDWDMIVVTVFLSILNQMEIHLVQNRKENCHHDHIPFNVKGNGNIVFSE